MVKDIRIEDYTYDLPDDRIAKYPLARRDDSQLLVYTETVGRKPFKDSFRNITSHLPSDSIIVFNNTKVVPARLFFKKETGSVIEIFCLEPYSPSDYQLIFAQTDSCIWKCMVGKLKRWKGETIHVYIGQEAEASDLLRDMDLTATLLERDGNVCTVRFDWKSGCVFSDVMLACGRIPIPPYLKRETESIDVERYQTYYARKYGSVAAPTAGLHFAKEELDAIDAAGIQREELCLHVGAGTFLPVKSETIGDHMMHSEPFSVTRRLVKVLSEKGDKPLTAVGTTSTRCLESLYFIGVHCIEQGEPGYVEQWEPYREEGYDYTLKQACDAILEYMDRNGLDVLFSRTRIIIVPGYEFRVLDYLVTNFHQPQSTLLLLIGAFVGDNWRDIYKFAMDNGFRFLSYGDSSLLQRITK